MPGTQTTLPLQDTNRLGQIGNNFEASNLLKTTKGIPFNDEQTLLQPGNQVIIGEGFPMVSSQPLIEGTIQNANFTNGYTQCNCQAVLQPGLIPLTCEQCMSGAPLQQGEIIYEQQPYSTQFIGQNTIPTDAEKCLEAEKLVKNRARKAEMDQLTTKHTTDFHRKPKVRTCRK